MSPQFLHEIQGRRIVYSVLNWGLGHASRSSCVIRLLSENNQLIILSDGASAQWLKCSFPLLMHIQLPGYNVSYAYRKMWLNIVTSLPQFLFTYFAEKKLINKLVRAGSCNLIISDHRWGCYSHSVPSYFLAHQLRILHSNTLIASVATFVHRCLIEKFAECWIPDNVQRSTSGQLSRLQLRIPVRFLGILPHLHPEIRDKDIDLLIVLSGPEPSRTQLESLLDRIAWPPPWRICMVRGTCESDIITGGTIKKYQLADSELLQNLINRSRHIICRSGYSSIMDLVHLNIPATLIPTPNHPEQQYLAHKYSGIKGFSCLSQEDRDFENKLIYSIKSSASA